MPPNIKENVPFLTRKDLNFEHGTTFRLRIEHISGQAVTLRVTGFTREGPFTYNIDTNGNEGQTFERFNIVDIPIALSVSTTSVLADSGGVFVSVWLEINNTPYINLANGHVNTSMGITWPYALTQTFLTDYGFINEVDSANPAAGAEATVTVAANTFWLLQAVAVILVADATVTSRRVRLELVRDGTTTELYSSAADILASETRRLVWGAGLAVIDDQTSGVFNMPLPHNYILRPGDIVRTSTSNLQAGDNFGVMSVYMRRYYSNDFS